MNDKQEDTQKRKENFRAIKAYSKISSIIYNLIGTILIGVVIGYILEMKFGDDLWMGLSIIFFSVCGIISFFIRMVKFK